MRSPTTFFWGFFRAKNIEDSTCSYIREASTKGDTLIEQSINSLTIGDITNQVTVDAPIDRQNSG